VANGKSEREEGVNLHPYLEMEQNVLRNVWVKT